MTTLPPRAHLPEDVVFDPFRYRSEEEGIEMDELTVRASDDGNDAAPRNELGGQRSE